MDAPRGHWQNALREDRWGLNSNATSDFDLHLKAIFPPNNRFTATYLLSLKPHKKDKEYMCDTAEEEKMKS